MFACLACGPLAADELAECADIKSAVERLDCYDRLARERAEADSEPPASGIDPVPQQEPEAPVERDGLATFGKEPEAAPVEVDHVVARIESVRKAPLGQHIMTLSNGQVWMENEPGRRRIRAGQEVIIRKRLLHYEMELKSQPDVTVRRVD